MATNTYALKTLTAVGTSFTGIYTVPSTKASMVISLFLSNIHTSGISVSVRVLDSSGGGSAYRYIIKDTSVPQGGSLDPFDNKMVLESGDVIEVKSDVASSLDALLTICEDIN